jgi:hypothetical protein
MTLVEAFEKKRCVRRDYFEYDLGNRFRLDRSKSSFFEKSLLWPCHPPQENWPVSKIGYGPITLLAYLYC